MHFIDESAFSKQGNASAGVARQHNGRLHKTDNCQVGVFSTPNPAKVFQNPTQGRIGARQEDRPNSRSPGVRI